MYSGLYDMQMRYVLHIDFFCVVSLVFQGNELIYLQMYSKYWKKKKV